MDWVCIEDASTALCLIPCLLRTFWGRGFGAGSGGGVRKRGSSRWQVGVGVGEGGRGGPRGEEGGSEGDDGLGRSLGTDLKKRGKRGKYITYIEIDLLTSAGKKHTLERQTIVKKQGEFPQNTLKNLAERAAQNMDLCGQSKTAIALAGGPTLSRRPSVRAGEVTDQRKAPFYDLWGRAGLCGKERVGRVWDPFTEGVRFQTPSPPPILLLVRYKIRGGEGYAPTHYA